MLPNQLDNLLGKKLKRISIHQKIQKNLISENLNQSTPILVTKSIM